MATHMDRPRNELEAALVAGADDEAARPRFYETLLKSQVLIVSMGETPSVVGGVVQGEAKLSLPTVNIEGEPHVPFFSSEARLPAGTSFLRLGAVDFFQMTSGLNLVLNPGSVYGKAFVPSEIASLLDGSLLKPFDTSTVRAGTQQLIGQPEDYPHELAAAVARFLASEPTVERAFLAQHFIEGMHTEPATLVAVVAPESCFERIAGAIGVIAREVRKTEGAVDVTRLQKKDLGYFADQEPIYTRKRKSLFAKLFG